MRTRTVGKRMVGSDWRWWRVILGAPFLGVGLGLSGLALSWVSATAVWPLCLAFGLTILAVGTQASFGHRRIVLDRENGRIAVSRTPWMPPWMKRLVITAPARVRITSRSYRRQKSNTVYTRYPVLLEGGAEPALIDDAGEHAEARRLADAVADYWGCQVVDEAE